MVIDDGSYLGVGTIVGDEGRLQFDLLDQLLMLLRVIQYIVIACCRQSMRPSTGIMPVFRHTEKLLDVLQSHKGEIRIAVVNGQDLCHHHADFLEAE